MKESVEYLGQVCSMPTSAICFNKCSNVFTKKIYREKFRDFNWRGKYQSGLITAARIHPFRKEYDIIIGCFVGMRKPLKYYSKVNIVVHF